jgi:hypothetical protein
MPDSRLKLVRIGSGKDCLNDAAEMEMGVKAETRLKKEKACGPLIEPVGHDSEGGIRQLGPIADLESYDARSHFFIFWQGKISRSMISETQRS